MAMPPKDVAASILAEYLKQPKRYRDPRISAQRPLCLFAAVSPDGFAWKPIEKPLMMHYADTDNTFCYDRENGKYVGHLHFADSNRRPVGMGHTDMKDISRALTEIGYERYASAEALPWPDSNAAAEQTMRAFKECFSAA